MGGLGELWTKISQTLKSSPRQTPSTITVARDHIAENSKKELDVTFKRGQHYFQVVVNELYLSQEREWLHRIDPVVYTVAEFSFAGKPQTVPFLVGPSLLKQKGVPDQYTKGVIIRNTSVSGMRPYRGGGLTLTIVLCEAKTDDYLRPLLRVIESAASALDFSPLLSPYIKVANVVMDGFESLFNSGGVAPLAGLRDSFGPNYKTPLWPSYYALIDRPGINPDRLWVRENQLLEGASLQSAKPYREADYVLYSITGPEDNRRDDLDALAFNDLWESVKKEAGSPIDDPNYKNAKAQMSALYQIMVNSPDLTEAQADELADEYAARMQTIHQRAVGFGNLGPGELSPSEKAREDRLRSKALAILSW